MIALLVAVTAQTPHIITNVTVCVNTDYNGHGLVSGCNTVNGRDTCPFGTVDTVFETNKCFNGSIDLPILLSPTYQSFMFYQQNCDANIAPMSANSTSQLTETLYVAAWDLPGCRNKTNGISVLGCIAFDTCEEHECCTPYPLTGFSLNGTSFSTVIVSPHDSSYSSLVGLVISMSILGGCCFFCCAVAAVLICRRSRRPGMVLTPSQQQPIVYKQQVAYAQQPPQYQNAVPPVYSEQTPFAK